MRRYNLRVKFENNEKMSSVSGFKRMPTTDGESEESEESPPKMAREEPAPGKGDEWRSPQLASPRGASTPHPAGVFTTPSPLTPVHDDMSPITMSAQRMPKAMQVRISRTEVEEPRLLGCTIFNLPRAFSCCIVGCCYLHLLYCSV